MSAAFTPGPWKMRNATSGTVLARREHTNGIGETMVWYAPVAVAQPWSGREREANARLIAAAPELYEALLEARIAVAADIEEAECGEDGRWASFLPVFVERLAKIDAALAKARGEQ